MNRNLRMRQTVAVVRPLRQASGSPRSRRRRSAWATRRWMIRPAGHDHPRWGDTYGSRRVICWRVSSPGLGPRPDPRAGDPDFEVTDRPRGF